MNTEKRIEYIRSYVLDPVNRIAIRSVLCHVTKEAIYLDYFDQGYRDNILQLLKTLNLSWELIPHTKNNGLKLTPYAFNQFNLLRTYALSKDDVRPIIASQLLGTRRHRFRDI